MRFCTSPVPTASPTSQRHFPDPSTKLCAAPVDLLYSQSSVASSPTASLAAKGTCPFTASPFVHLQPSTLIFTTFSCVLALIPTGVTACLIRVSLRCIVSSSLITTSPRRSYAHVAVRASQSHHPSVATRFPDIALPLPPPLPLGSSPRAHRPHRDIDTDIDTDTDFSIGNGDFSHHPRAFDRGDDGFSCSIEDTTTRDDRNTMYDPGGTYSNDSALSGSTQDSSSISYDPAASTSATTASQRGDGFNNSIKADTVHDEGDSLSGAIDDNSDNSNFVYDPGGDSDHLDNNSSHGHVSSNTSHGHDRRNHNVTVFTAHDVDPTPPLDLMQAAQHVFNAVPLPSDNDHPFLPAAHSRHVDATPPLLPPQALRNSKYQA